jgi:hypothetical protein
VDSNRIVNLMAADVFFNRKISSRYRNRVEKERFRLQPVKAKKLLNKPVKPSSRGIEFTERQIAIAIAALKGKP